MKMKSMLMGALALGCACAFGGENPTGKTQKVVIDGYTWSYRVQNGEATIVNEKDGQFSTAVSPGPTGQLAIPAKINGVKVTCIGRAAFGQWCDNLKSVIIPGGVKRIGMDAFKNCSGLSAVTIPSGVEAIEEGAFDHCSGLTSVTIPNGVKSIGSCAFRECKKLASVKIPEGVTSVGRDVFAGCDSLVRVTIPSSLSHIGWGMFGNCVNLESVTILPGVRSIDQWAFVNCNRLTAVTIPPGVCSIDNGAFRYCNSVKTVSIPKSVTNIHGAAFCESGTLTSFRVAEGNPVYKSVNGMLLTKDGATLVHGVNGYVTIPSTVTEIGGGAFEGFRALASIEIPSNVKVIVDYAFQNCKGLTSVKISSGVQRIGRNAFHGCEWLKSLTIPASLTNIDRTAFGDCPNLKTVNVVSGGKTETISFDEFSKLLKQGRQGNPGATSAAQKLAGCDFLLNKDFKKNAKYYLCLFSASWCGPCCREMPRIAKTYAETLKADPNIELVHFSCDKTDAKALAWAKEHDVKFPVVKPKGGNPLNLQSRSIPHLFIVKADGTLVEEGHPASLFTDEKLQTLK